MREAWFIGVSIFAGIVIVVIIALWVKEIQECEYEKD